MTKTAELLDQIGLGISELQNRETVRSGRISFDGNASRLIFVHSSFRTGSTWLWSKFRSVPRVCAYYEVFHEVLASLNVDIIRSSDGSDWFSGHPIQAPYFLEYSSLLRDGGGVLDYDHSMAFQRFIPEGGYGGEMSVTEQMYLETLVGEAWRGHKIPVLTCTRSLGRMTAIKSGMNVTNVLIYRNLFHQWASYSGQFLRGNPYFLNSIDKTIKSCPQDAFIALLDRMFSTRRSEPTSEQLLIVFVLMHLQFYANAVDAADVIIDLSSLITDRTYRGKIEEELSQIVGTFCDLSDVKSNFEVSVVTVHDRQRFVKTIEQYVKLITSTCITEKASAFVVSLKDQFLAEWERHDFFTRHGAVFHSHKSKELESTIKKIKNTQAIAGADIVKLTALHDGLAARLAETAAAHVAAEAQVAAVATERDRLAVRLVETIAARDAAEARAEATMAEYDGLCTRLVESAVARDAAEGRATAAEAERDGLAAHLKITGASIEETLEL